MKAFIDANLLIYLNAVKTLKLRALYTSFYLSILQRYRASTDILVMDELLYISWRRYKIPYEATISFIDSAVLPYVEVLPLTRNEYVKAAEILKTYKVKPFDALHAAVMLMNDVPKIVTEDKEFSRIKGIEVEWFE